MKTQQPLEALKKAKADGDEWRDFCAMDNPRCPHCGAVYVISKHDAWRMYEEGEHEGTCGECDLDFKVRTRVAYSFSTDEQDDEPEGEQE